MARIIRVFAIQFNSTALRSACIAMLFAVLWGTTALGIPTHHWDVRPGFTWPQSVEAAYGANRLPSDQIVAFLTAGLEWPANDMPYFNDFLFARLGPKEICLAARWSRRDAYETEVICPDAAGGYWDTTLGLEAPGPLAWYVVDLGRDGSLEVVTSEGLNLPFPTYWYEVYSFMNGRPQDVSAKFPKFYMATLLPQLDEVEHALGGDLFSGERNAARVQWTRMMLTYTQLKYQRRILGDRKAGLEQGLSWIKSPYTDVQGLGMGTLADIRDPRSISALTELGRTTKNQAICVNIVNALATLEGRASGGIISDPDDIRKVQACESMKPEPPRLLQ